MLVAWSTCNRYAIAYLYLSIPFQHLVDFVVKAHASYSVVKLLLRVLLPVLCIMLAFMFDSELQ